MEKKFCLVNGNVLVILDFIHIKLSKVVKMLGFKIGLGIYEYNFPSGMVMGGYSARNKPSVGTHDPITARATVFIGNEKNPKKKVLIIEAEFIGLEKTRVTKLKEELAKKYQLLPEQILIAVTHPHSSVLNINLFTTASPNAKKMVDEGIRAAVQNAFNSLFEGYLEYYVGDIDKVSFNRRDWDKNSEAVSKEMIILKLFDDTKKLRGLMYNWSCHPVVMQAENLQLTADWPYFTQQFLRKELKEPTLIVQFLQGTPGNLNPRNVPFSGTVTNTFKDCQEIGDDVGRQMLKILTNSPQIFPVQSDPKSILLGGLLLEIEIPVEDADKAEFFKEFTNTIEINGKFYVRTIVQALRVGPLGLVGFPGEMFSDIGLEIKNAKIFPATLVIGYANDYIGYAGSTAVYQAGGYEMMMMSIGPEEGPMLTEAALTLLKNTTLKRNFFDED
jgi:hypothetical protein